MAIVSSAHATISNVSGTKRLLWIGRLEHNRCLRAPCNLYRKSLRQHLMRPSYKTSLPLFRASQEELPAELLEDAKFVPINDDDPQYGPAAILLMGMSYSEAAKVQDFLHNMGGEFLKVLICTEEMIKGTLWDAMNSFQPQLEKVKAAKDLPRICFLSGLTGEEIMMFVDAFPEASKDLFP